MNQTACDMIPDSIMQLLRENRKITYMDLTRLGYSYYHSRKIIKIMIKNNIIKRSCNIYDPRVVEFLEVIY